MKFLEDQGYFDENKQLLVTIICNNCKGKNKHNKVLQLAPYLVEAGYFQRVTFTFLVAGHRKNGADKKFNNKKQIYTKENLYTMKQLTAASNKNKYITEIQFNHTVFLLL